MKEIADRYAINRPGGLSSMPAAVAATASTAQIPRKMNVRFLLRGVENASSMADPPLGSSTTKAEVHA
jgi:hypothetical protein